MVSTAKKGNGDYRIMEDFIQSINGNDDDQDQAANICLETTAQKKSIEP